MKYRKKKRKGSQFSDLVCLVRLIVKLQLCTTFVTCIFPFSTFTVQSFIWTVFQSIFLSSRGSSVAELELLFINFLLTVREGRSEEYWPDGVAIRKKTPEGLVVVVAVSFACFLLLLRGITALQTD